MERRRERERARARDQRPVEVEERGARHAATLREDGERLADRARAQRGDGLRERHDRQRPPPSRERPRATGQPSSAASRMIGSSGIRARSGTPISSASAWPPPEPKSSWPGADEVRHVLDRAEDAHARLLRHLRGPYRDLLRGRLRRRHDERLGARQGAGRATSRRRPSREACPRAACRARPSGRPRGTARAPCAASARAT